MALRTIYKNASDYEIAALYSLDLLWASDIEDIAVKWMIEGKGGENVAFLASQWHTYLQHINDEIQNAFQEIKISIPTQKLALKTVLKFHLQQILLCPDQYMMHFHELIDLDRLYANKIILFQRSDCDEYFEKHRIKYPNSKSSKFAAQDFGIEKLYGLYYTQDDYDKWTQDLENKRKSAVLKEAKIVLDKFYKD